MKLYFDNTSAIDTMIQITYGDWKSSTKFESITDCITRMQRNFEGVDLVNSYYFGKLFDSMNYDYDPISNYNRNEEWTDTRTPDLTTTDTSQPFTDTSITENQVAPFDTNEYKNQIKSTSTLQSASKSGSRKETGNEVTTRKGKINGNIGVMSTQDMIKQERDIVNINFTMIVVKAMINSFFIMESGVLYET